MAATKPRKRQPKPRTVKPCFDYLTDPYELVIRRGHLSGTSC